LHVDTGTIDAVARPKDLVDFGDKIGEVVRWFR
jgi:hypothetical protein